MRETEEADQKKSRNKNNAGAYTQISVRLPGDLLNRIEAFAKADRRSRSNAIEHLLWQTVKGKR